MTYQQYYETEETARLEFARKAAAYFGDHPEAVTFATGGPQKGELMAFRWGMSGDCVLVFKVDDCEPIINYCNFVPRDKAQKHLDYNNAGMNAVK